MYVKNRVDPDQLIDVYTNRKSHHNSLIKQEWDFSELKRKYYYNPILRSISRHVPQKGKMLDIGCASGAFLNAARIAGWAVLGIELETASIEVARSHDLTVYQTTLQEQSFPDNHFD
ncbi:MAG: class I SAM-dependent methyltransferase, partial [Candidatus Omnitrophota bacterium]